VFELIIVFIIARFCAAPLYKRNSVSNSYSTGYTACDQGSIWRCGFWLRVSMGTLWVWRVLLETREA